MTTVQACGLRHAADINFNDAKSASKWERLTTVRVTRARDALKQPTGTYTKVHRDTMSDLLKAMLVTHGSIGNPAFTRSTILSFSNCAIAARDGHHQPAGHYYRDRTEDGIPRYMPITSRRRAADSGAEAG